MLDLPLSPLPEQALTAGRGSGMLWLCCADGDRLRLFERLRVAGASQAERTKITRSVYYDTSRRRLLRAGYHLSVRTQQGKRFQDIERPSAAALAPSTCWTAKLEADAPGRASLDNTPLEGIIGDKAAEKLKRVFVIDIRRRSNMINRKGSSIAASVDTGTIGADGVVQHICELRLELVSGTREALFDLASELGSAVPLTVTLRPPGERGFRLLPAGPDHSVDTPSADVRQAMTIREAADGVCRCSAATLLDNLAQLASDSGQDALHRARIELRRLRALLWFLKPMLGADVATLSSRLRSLAQSLGGARELDVFCDHLLAPLRRDHPDAPGIDSLFDSFDRRRHEAHAKVMALARSPAMLDFSLALVNGLAALSISESSEKRHWQSCERPVAVFVRARLHSCLKAFLKKSRDLQHCTPDLQHDIRIKAKKLRYAVEAFHPIIGAKRSRKLTTGLICVQDLLGELNDARTGYAIALAYARDGAGDGDCQPTHFATGLAAATCALDPTVILERAARARDSLAALARQ